MAPRSTTSTESGCSSWYRRIAGRLFAARSREPRNAVTDCPHGNDFDERLLQAMADAGGGHFYYIADAAQIRDHIASEVGETLEVVARDRRRGKLHRGGGSLAAGWLDSFRPAGHGCLHLPRKPDSDHLGTAGDQTGNNEL